MNKHNLCLIFMKQKVYLRILMDSKILKMYLLISMYLLKGLTMIICKTPREIEIMREAGRIVALLSELKKHIRPGITTKNMDVIAEQFIRKHECNSIF